ncbi:MAG: hypothetical protein ACLFQZ_01860 [Spirochaetaceae bacterium]
MRYLLPKATLLLLSFLFLTGCLSVETRVTLIEEERGELTYLYTVDRELLDAEVFDRESEDWPIPIARRDFELFADAVPDAELSSYSREDGEEESVVTATFSFDSLDALERLLSTREAIAVEPREGEFGLRFQLSPLSVADLSEEQRAFLRSYLDDSRVTFTVTTPEPVKYTTLEEATGRTVTVTRSMEELLDRPNPLFLELGW